MSREIKYRGINEETGAFVYGYYTKLLEGIRRIDAIISDVDGDLTRFYIHQGKTIGQFTGLKDRNGVDIYEGDIVKDIYGQINTIEFKGGSFWFNWLEMPHYLDQVEKGEVIGNIHQHP